MDFLRRILNIKTDYTAISLSSLPGYLVSAYDIRGVRLDGVDAVIATPKGPLPTVTAIQKQMAKISMLTGSPAILIADNLTSRQRNCLLRDRVPFISEGKQIYLPFMGIYLSERFSAEATPKETMLPSAELLLLYYIYSGCGKIKTSEAAEKLGLTATSVSRASKQLVQFGLLVAERKGVDKLIFSEKSPKELFSTAKSLMPNPVKRVVYAAKNELIPGLMYSGISALSEYTMINPSETEYYAATGVSGIRTSDRLDDPVEQCAVEIWRYDPKKISNGKCVDRLSLALSLSDNADERIEGAVEEMLENVWRGTNGQRN